MMQSKLPTYRAILDIIDDESRITLPSELHGFICGVLCGDRRLNEDSQLKLIFDLIEEEGLQIMDLQSTVKQILLATRQLLQSAEFTFEILLPSDEQRLAIRTQALASFCQGFLEGLGIAGIQQAFIEQANLSEALNHIAKISHVESVQKTSQSNENAYMELVEYIRNAILLIYMETSTKIPIDVH